MHTILRSIVFSQHIVHVCCDSQFHHIHFRRTSLCLLFIHHSCFCCSFSFWSSCCLLLFILFMLFTTHSCTNTIISTSPSQSSHKCFRFHRSPLTVFISIHDPTLCPCLLDMFVCVRVLCVIIICLSHLRPLHLRVSRTPQMRFTYIYSYVCLFFKFAVCFLVSFFCFTYNERACFTL